MAAGMNVAGAASSVFEPLADQCSTFISQLQACRLCLGYILQAATPPNPYLDILRPIDGEIATHHLPPTVAIKFIYDMGD
jgi:hypothetical protein